MDRPPISIPPLHSESREGEYILSGQSGTSPALLRFSNFREIFNLRGRWHTGPTAYRPPPIGLDSQSGIPARLENEVHAVPSRGGGGGGARPPRRPTSVVVALRARIQGLFLGSPLPTVRPGAGLMFDVASMARFLTVRSLLESSESHRASRLAAWGAFHEPLTNSSIPLNPS